MENKDYIGRDFDCVFDGKIKRCKIIEECAKNSFWVIIDDTIESILSTEEINLKNDDNWVKINNRKIQRWNKLLKEYHKLLDERYSNKSQKDKNHQEALKKNEKLSEILHDKRETMCGVGTRKIKLMLNRLVKQGDTTAELYRKAIEVEDCNIRAKETNYYYKGKIYRQKSSLLMELVNRCLELGVPCGKQMVDGRETNCIVYFELPGVEQISFHTTLDYAEQQIIPDYEKAWDGKVCSTLGKLEKAINEKYMY